MSRSALILSIALHGGMLAILEWSFLTASGRAGPGKSGIGIAFSPEDAGGLLIESSPPDTPPLARISPPVFETPPPAPVIDVRPTPLTPADPVPPPVTTIASLPREFPSIPSPKKTRAGARSATASTKVQSSSSNTGVGANGGTAMGPGHGSGGGPGYVPPQFLMRYKPPYPEQARARKLEGVVLLLVSVDTAGHVTHAQLAQSCGHDLLDRAALTAVRSWRFTPARQANQVIPATVEVPIRFHFSA